ncbi:hypothetical protein N9J09_00450 [bacterium]|jgi:hypothetical protein|nr:hypothetical protein [bacterium]
MEPFVEKRRALRFDHGPLNIFTILTLVGVVIVAFLYFTDTRELLGVPIWEKPLKFLISGAIYTATLSWFYSLVTRAKKAAYLFGVAIVIFLAIEIIVIAGMAASGQTSHFNVSSAFNIAIWSVMATAIAAVWGATFGVAAMLWRTNEVSTLVRSGIRCGVVIALLGMGIAFTMTPPNESQLSGAQSGDWEGIAGAHTVGAADGGQGLPFLGWSTVAGDLRISHFLGLHAIQVLPLFAVLIAATVSSRSAQKALVGSFATIYVLSVLVLYFQALAGQSIVAPSNATIAWFGASLATAISVGLVVWYRESKKTSVQ